MFEQFLDAAEPVLVTVIGGILSALFGAVLLAARRYLGDRATDILRKSLTEAMERGIAQGYASGSNAPELDAVSYVERTMGDTIKRLGASTGGLLDRARAEIAQRQGREPNRP
ncbi:hypothetical protein [Oceaniglobus indicus]|uniref:hypothetical protein n=1 Tax=Oceaniglobus indicus TaxID=2047749 RepID=UPI000C19B644|nr:hypothetical protein [Oceaniglobus indicus]